MYHARSMDWDGKVRYTCKYIDIYIYIYNEILIPSPPMEEQLNADVSMAERSSLGASLLSRDRGRFAQHS